MLNKSTEGFHGWSVRWKFCSQQNDMTDMTIGLHRLANMKILDYEIRPDRLRRFTAASGIDIDGGAR